METTYTGARYSAKATCDTCGAVVPQVHQDKHSAWHAELDRRTLEHWPHIGPHVH